MPLSWLDVVVSCIQGYEGQFEANLRVANGMMMQ
jgi:hypothetical protein